MGADAASMAACPAHQFPKHGLARVHGLNLDSALGQQPSRKAPIAVAQRQRMAGNAADVEEGAAPVKESKGPKLAASIHK